MRGGMTLRIGVPGTIRAGCAGSRTAEPTDIAPSWLSAQAPASGAPHIVPGSSARPAAKGSIRLDQYASWRNMYATKGRPRGRAESGGRVGAMAAQRRKFAGGPAGRTRQAHPEGTGTATQLPPGATHGPDAPPAPA